MDRRILFATSEAHPLIKTGGLADVSAALPAALREAGLDVRLLLPGYPEVLDRLATRTVYRRLETLPDTPASLLIGDMPDTGVPVYVLHAPALFQRPGGPYQDANGEDYADNVLRFGALSMAAAILGAQFSPLDWRPHVLHLNDWQTGLAAAYLNAWDTRATPCLMNVHNLSFTGSFPADLLPRLDLPQRQLRVYGLEFYGDVSFLKAGLYYADLITTVSPTYAREIQTPEFGCGLHGLLADRHDVLHGVLNGIDTHEWDPAHDTRLAMNYDSRSVDAGKRANKADLQRVMGLTANSAVPLIGIVSRLTYQKGIDLSIAALEQAKGRFQVAVLGAGDESMNSAMRSLAARHPGQIAVRIGYDEALAHRIEAACDFFLMPSRFEPCGLNQMYSMHYGALPIVRATGGLADTVCDPLDVGLEEATGFVFEDATVAGLSGALDRALECFATPRDFAQIRGNAMRQNFAWRHSAARYAEIYAALSTAVRAPPHD